jgi:uncharacterized protein YndB with AHSA1/START domain
LLKSVTLSISINRSPQVVYDFVSNAEHLPKWANMFCLSVTRANGDWIVETPQQGQVKLRFAEGNAFGVLDHYVTVSPGIEVYVPMRVVQNGQGSEVLFTLFQTKDMPDEKFAEDVRWVNEDRRNLKNVLEAKA